MRLTHVLHAVGDDFAARQGVEHTVVSHGDAVVDGYRIELSRKTAELLNSFLYDAGALIEVNVSRHKLRERIGDGNNRLAKMLLFHTVGTPKSTCRRHKAT